MPFQARFRYAVLTTAALVGTSALAGCGTGSSGTGGSPLAAQGAAGTVVVGSDNFPETERCSRT